MATASFLQIVLFTMVSRPGISILLIGIVSFVSVSWNIFEDASKVPKL